MLRYQAKASLNASGPAPGTPTPISCTTPAKAERGDGTGRRGQQAGPAPGHPDVGRVDERRRDAEVEQHADGRHAAPGVFGGKRMAELVAAEGEDVAREQDQPAQRERPAGQQQAVGPAGPGAHEQRQPGGSDEAQDDRRRPREQQPTAVAVEPADGPVGVGQHEATAASRGEQTVRRCAGAAVAAGSGGRGRTRRGAAR